MWREVSVMGVLFTPGAVYLLAAAAIYFPLRVALVRSGAARWFWNFPLAGAAMYICILGALAAFL